MRRLYSFVNDLYTVLRVYPNKFIYEFFRKLFMAVAQMFEAFTIEDLQDILKEGGKQVRARLWTPTPAKRSSVCCQKAPT